jgi:TIR domain-containing protein
MLFWGAADRGSIFVYYRRDDDASFAGRLHDRLASSFHRDAVFFDVSSIGAGVDFTDEIEARISKCDILLAVIGRSWLGSGEPNSSRLNDPEDFVRQEIEAAFRQGTFVIPVLSHNAQFPSRDVLPESLRGLTRRNYRKISHERFHADVDQLIQEIKRTIKDLKRSRKEDPDSDARMAIVPLLGPAGSGKTSLLAALRQSIRVGTGYTSASEVQLLIEPPQKSKSLDDPALAGP